MGEDARVLGYRERQVLDYAKATIADTGVAPSYEMISRELGMFDRGNVSRIVARLERKRFLCRVGTGHARRIRLVAL